MRDRSTLREQRGSYLPGLRRRSEWAPIVVILLFVLLSTLRAVGILAPHSAISLLPNTTPNEKARAIVQLAMSYPVDPKPAVGFIDAVIEVDGSERLVPPSGSIPLLHESDLVIRGWCAIPSTTSSLRSADAVIIVADGGEPIAASAEERPDVARVMRDAGLADSGYAALVPISLLKSRANTVTVFGVDSVRRLQFRLRSIKLTK